MLLTPARAKFTHFSIPYFFADDHVFFNKTSKAADLISNAQKLDSLLSYPYGKVLGYGYGDGTDFLLSTMNIEKVFIANDRKALLRLAQKKMVDWIILSELEAFDLERNYSISKYLARNKTIIANHNKWHLMYSKQTVDNKIVQAFNKIILIYRNKLPSFTPHL